MLQFIMEQNLLLYICTAACVLGVVSQFVLRHLYESLTREMQSGGEPKGRFLRQIRQRFQNCVHLNEKVSNIASFTERSILDYRFLKMNLHQWQRMGWEALAVCLLCCGGGLWLLHRNGTAVSLETGYSQAAIWSLLILGIAYGLTDNGYRRRCLKIRLMDYLENSGAVRSYGEVEFPDRIPEGAREAAAGTEQGTPGRRKLRQEGSETKAQKEKRELKESIFRSKASQETAAAQEKAQEKERGKDLLRQMDPKEKEQILRDVLLEFLT